MGIFNPDDQIYTVHFERRGTGNLAHRPFEGDRAFSDAGEFYDLLRLDPDVIYVDMSRFDGSDWQCVARPMRRSAEGDWEPDQD